MNFLKQIDFNTVKSGVTFGFISIIVCLMGMVETFHKKFIIQGLLSLGQAFLLCILISACYITAKKFKDRSPNILILNCMFTGLIFALICSSFIIIGTNINLRYVFVNASSDLFNIICFSLPLSQGIFLLIMLGCFCGFFTGLTHFLSRKMKKTILIGTSSIIFIGIFQETIRSILLDWDNAMLSWIVNFCFPQGNGLSLSGVFFLTVLLFLFRVIWEIKGRNSFELVNQSFIDKEKIRPGFRYVFYLIILFFLPFILNTSLCEVMSVIGIYILLGLGLNIVVGFAGLLDLGYVAFFAIGAYTTAILTSSEVGLFNLNFWQAVPFSVLAGCLAGILLGIPVLNMRGDYLAIVTLGFGEILRILARSDFLKPILQGSQGVSGFPKASIGTWVIDSPKDNYYLVLFGCLLALVISIRLEGSRIARAWMAIRDDEDVAQALGINLVSLKLKAFAIGAAFSSLAGAIFANKIGSVFPVSFNLIVSLNLVCMIIIGGLGSIKGVIVGAILMVGIPELLKEFAQFRDFFYGIGLITVMILRPEGICPTGKA